MGAGAEASATGALWWPTGMRPRCRMPATRRPGPAGAPRLHGEAVRARTRARARGRGRGERGRAEPASASGPEARPRPASAPFSLFPFFFLKFFSQILFQKHFDYFQVIFTIFTQKQSCSKTKTLPLCFNKQNQIPNRI